MSYYGDISTSAIVYLSFTTVDSGRAPIVLTGSPAVSVYKDDGTTESTAGVTLSASFDGRTGFNLVKIDTSADGTFYAAAHDFTVVVTAGTVDGVSAVGYVVGSFSIEHRSVGSGTAPSAATVAAAVWDRLLTAITTADSIGKMLKDNINDTITSRASQTSLNTVDDLIDTEITTIHNFIDTEVGAILTKVTDLTYTGTNLNVNVKAYNGVDIVEATVVTDAGNTALTFKTGRTETATDFWKDAFFRFRTGTLAGQTHRITGYNGTTKFLTFTTAFTAVPTGGDIGEFINR